MKKTALTLIIAALTASYGIAAEPVDVIPAPQSVQLTGRKAAAAAAKNCTVKTDGKMGAEAYELKIKARGVEITAGSPAGEFYARQTLEQLADNLGYLPVGIIKDSPRFEWRGFMLDESRHFLGEEYVLKTLDLMARYKFNKFHWHLTDSESWRLEIKKYPLLTEVGGKGCKTDPNAPARFYTQEQIRKIVAYAAERHIEVIPEFDMPGHATAACRAYPYLSGGKHPKYPDFTFNVGSERTYEFISDVLDEIFELFPSKYIHIGGDEVTYGNSCWSENEDICKLMEREGLQNHRQVEGWFHKKVAEIVELKGHKLIAWDDVMEGGVMAEGETVMWWRHERPDHLSASLDGGIKTILTPRRPLYMDFVQYPGHTQGRNKWGKDYVCCTVKDIYEFPEVNVSGVEMTPERLQNVLGIQGNLWTETVNTSQRADYMLWPRLCAIAESGWTPVESKDYSSFEKRLLSALKYLQVKGVNFFDLNNPSSSPEPPVASKPVVAD